jgi:hypothetical protein
VAFQLQAKCTVLPALGDDGQSMQNLPGQLPAWPTANRMVTLPEAWIASLSTLKRPGHGLVV